MASDRGPRHATSTLGGYDRPMIREAATVIVLRPGPAGPEVLLVRRSHKTGFFPYAWVFPGGAVDPVDATAQARGAVPGLGPEHRAHALAAIRECREETGIRLGGSEGSPDLSGLRLWSWWLTPEAEPRRYNTLFFAAAVQAGSEVTLAPQELTDKVWLTARAALERATDRADPMFMAPPTFRTLEQLVPFERVEDVLAAERRVTAVCTRLETGPDGAIEIVLPGDPSYPSHEPVEGPTRIRYAQGRWWSVT